ncbi:hypothetical protein OWV82_017800 [Melia azedarach]|uniref:Uncharacterized protein n=1 Tax=Melia azedarach TaxID=155640 RepID=A0ACC1X8G8_MELAZ|nr:hypothetical protein OWV82_017800 [Melia azedarach]
MRTLPTFNAPTAGSTNNNNINISNNTCNICGGTTAVSVALSGAVSIRRPGSDARFDCVCSPHTGLFLLEAFWPRWKMAIRTAPTFLATPVCSKASSFADGKDTSKNEDGEKMEVGEKVKEIADHEENKENQEQNQ